MMNLRGIALFVRVCDEGSFSAAARAEGIAQSMVSRHVASLEEELGVELLSRTTRRVEPTSAGRAFLGRAREVLGTLTAARTELGDSEEKPSGFLRVTAPTTLGRRYLMPVVVGFMERHPAVRIELRLKDSNADLVSEGIDLAIRVGALADSALKCQRLGVSRLVPVCSPGYLAKCGPIRDISDFERLDPIMIRSGGRLVRGWRTPDGQNFVGGEPRVIVDDLEAAQSAAIAGLGMTLLPTWLISEDLAAQRLVSLLDEPVLEPLPVWLLHRDAIPPRARVLRNHLINEFRLSSDR